jgi:hypothetical protein
LPWNVWLLWLVFALFVLIGVVCWLGWWLWFARFGCGRLCLGWLACCGFLVGDVNGTDAHAGRIGIIDFLDL